MDSFTGRFDHVVILVADLDASSRRFERLGFSVSPGGDHVGLGTHNAVIRFGLDYLELLGVRDEAEARRSGGSTRPIVDWLRAGRCGLASFALATADIDRDAQRLRATGLPAVGPYPMQRRRPDGSLLSWRLLVPGGASWGRPWPFFIQWDQDDATRLRWERPAAHANGTRRVVGVSVAIADLDAAADLYHRQLGLTEGEAIKVADLGSRHRTFVADGFSVSVHAPDGPGYLRDRIATRGEGIFEVVLEAPDLVEPSVTLRAAGIVPQSVGAAIVVPSSESLGTRLVFVGAER